MELRKFLEMEGLKNKIASIMKYELDLEPRSEIVESVSNKTMVLLDDMMRIVADNQDDQGKAAGLMFEYMMMIMIVQVILLELHAELNQEDDDED